MNTKRLVVSAPVLVAVLTLFVLFGTLLGGHAQPVLAKAGPQSNQAVWGITPTVALVNAQSRLEIHDSLGISLTTGESLSSRPAWIDDRFVLFSRISGLDQELMVYDLWSGLTQTLGITGYMPAVRYSDNEVVFVQSDGPSANHLMTATLTVSEGIVSVANTSFISIPVSICKNPNWAPNGTIVASCRGGYLGVILQRQVNGSWILIGNHGHGQDFVTYDDANGLIYQGNAPDISVYRNGELFVYGIMQPNCVNGTCVAMSPSGFVATREVIEFSQSGLTRTLFSTPDAYAGFPAVAPLYVELPQPIVGLVAACDNNKQAGQVVYCGWGIDTPMVGTTSTWTVSGTTQTAGSMVSTVITVSGEYVAKVQVCNRYGCQETSTPPFTVQPAKLDGIVINSIPAELVVVHTGQSYSLTAEMSDEYGNHIDLQTGQEMWWLMGLNDHVVFDGFGSLAVTMTVKSCGVPTVTVAVIRSGTPNVVGRKDFKCETFYQTFLPSVMR